MYKQLSKFQLHNGYTWLKALFIIFVILLAFLLLLVLPFSPLPIHLNIDQTQKLVYFNRTFAEIIHYTNLIQDKRNSSSSIEMAVHNDPWALEHIRGNFGLRLVSIAANTGRQRILKMLLSAGAPADGLVDLGYLDTKNTTTPLRNYLKRGFSATIMTGIK